MLKKLTQEIPDAINRRGRPIRVTVAQGAVTPRRACPFASV